MSPLIDFRKLAVSLAMFALVAFGSSAIARADSITFDLNVPNAGISGFSGPYASVTINQTSLTTATITFQTYAGFLIGGAQAADLNFNGGPVTFSGLIFTGGCTGGGCPAGGTGFSGGGAQQADGFGNFSFTLDNTDGFTNAVTSLTFNVSCPTCNWTSANQVLIDNALGNSAAAHIFVINSDCGGSPCTGFATAGEVPEPTSMILLGTGLLGIGAGIRKRLRR
jgi:PEP-CTERM motif-containing protein